MKQTIIQVYQDAGGKTLFAQIVKSKDFEARGREDEKVRTALDNMLEGSERIYESDTGLTQLNKQFFLKIVRPHRDWRKEESFEMRGAKDELIGVSYPFYPKHYDALTREIQEKLGLQAK